MRPRDRSGSAGVVEFMRALSVCHSAVIEASDPNEAQDIVVDTTKHAKRQTASCALASFLCPSCHVCALASCFVPLA